VISVDDSINQSTETLLLRYPYPYAPRPAILLTVKTTRTNTRTHTAKKHESFFVFDIPKDGNPYPIMEEISRSRGSTRILDDSDYFKSCRHE